MIQYDALATVNDPPNTEAFDPVHRRAAITSRPLANVLPTTLSSSGDLSHINGILSAVERLVSRIPGTPQRRSRHLSSAVTTPSHHTTNATAHSLVSDEPLVYTPTDIALFLHFAQDRLGVQNALDYEAVLLEAAFGPDILSKVTVLQLTELGIKSGDAVRLRENADAWWNREARKSRKHAMQEEDEPEPEQNAQRSKRARVYYKTTYLSGGGKRWGGGPLVERKAEYVADPDIESIEYYNEATLKFCPIPNGFVAPKDQDFDDDETPAT